MRFLSLIKEKQSEVNRLNQVAKTILNELCPYDYEFLTYKSKEYFLGALKTRTPNVVFLSDSEGDLEKTARSVNELAPECLILVLIDYQEFLDNPYASEHTYYVFREAQNQLLEPVIRTVIARGYKASNEDNLLVQYCGEMNFLKKQKIVYVEKSLRLAHFHMESREVFTCYASIEQLFAWLNHPEFIRCHRAYIVNKTFIRKISENKIYLANGEVIPLGLTYITPVHESLQD